MAAVCALALGCYKNVGSVVVDVRPDGSIVRCDLVVGRQLFVIGDDSLERCTVRTR